MVTISSKYPLIFGLRPQMTAQKQQIDYIGEIARYNSTIFREGNREGFARENDADTDAKKFVRNALGRALGRRLNTTDPKAMLATIERAFTSTMNDAGTRVFEWTPRSYAVQTELGGKVTGAQASLYRRAKSALDEILPLLDRIEPLEDAPDEEEVDAIRAIVRQEITTLVDELGLEGGWRESRVNLLFSNLLGNFDPLTIGGHLRDLARIFGFTPNNRIVTIAEEEILTDFTVISDLIQSLRVSWQNILQPNESQFLGTKVVLLERALHSLAEGVDELRYVMESVGLGPAERRVVRLEYIEISALRSYRRVNLTIAELLDWILNFATEEAPNLIENAGSFGINTLLSTLNRLYQIVRQVLNANASHNALQTSRVENALNELASHVLQVNTLIVPDDRLIKIGQIPQAFSRYIMTIASHANSLKTQQVNHLHHQHDPCYPTSKFDEEPLFMSIAQLFEGAGIEQWEDDIYPNKTHHPSKCHCGCGCSAHQCCGASTKAHAQPAYPVMDTESGDVVLVEVQQPSEEIYAYLDRLYGVGDVSKQFLMDQAISCQTLAEMSDDDLNQLLKTHNLNVSPARYRWQEQARFILAEDWDELDLLQEALKPNRKSGNQEAQ